MFSGYTDHTPVHMKALRLHSSVTKSCFEDLEELPVIPIQLMGREMVLYSVPAIAVLQAMSSLLCNLIAQLRLP